MRCFHTLFIWVFVSVVSFGDSLGPVSILVPESWTTAQNLKTKGVLLKRFTKGKTEVALYFENGESDIALKLLQVPVRSVSHRARSFKFDVFFLSPLEVENVPTQYEVMFSANVGAGLFYGKVRTFSADRAWDDALTWMDNLSLSASNVQSRSITGDDFNGKKYYLGWGAAMSGDPSMMHNEVKYDVLHTHDIFTQSIGGNYIGKKLIGVQAASGSAIRAEWSALKDVMTWHDMYVQYSSGHGSETGLAVGTSYKEMAKFVTSIPVREAIVFTMACHSGGLVEEIDKLKSNWENWGEYGRTLFVFASSKRSELSSTGPGTDPKESNGPNGSAGSAFGHALWKALSGEADGFNGSVKDGLLSLGEIKDFTIKKTQSIGGHTPVFTGVFDPNLIMNQVPSESEIRQLLNTISISKQGR